MASYIQTEDNGAIIEAPADLDADTRLISFINEARGFVESGKTTITIDFARVNAISSRALGKFLSLNRLIVKKNGTLSFINVNAKIYSIFKRLSFDEFVSFPGKR